MTISNELLERRKILPLARVCLDKTISCINRAIMKHQKKESLPRVKSRPTVTESNLMIQTNKSRRKHRRK